MCVRSLEFTIFLPQSGLNPSGDSPASASECWDDGQVSPGPAHGLSARIHTVRSRAGLVPTDRPLLDPESAHRLVELKDSS